MSKGRVLVVDDEEDIVELLFESVQSAGFEVDKAFNGRDANLMLNLNTYDAIVSDMKMPELDGVGLMQVVRDKFGSKIPIWIAISGAFEEKFKKSEVEILADLYIEKPFDVSDLVSKLEDLLEKKRAKK